MAFALIVLALGSIAAGWVGVPHALKGHNEIETFLEPSFEAHAMAPANEFQVTEGRPRLRDAAAGQAGAPAAPGEAAAVHEAPAASEETELLLMGVSTGLALTGIGLAAYFWLRNRAAADKLAGSLAPLHTLLLNKYYVDEAYDAAIVHPLRDGSSAVLWKVVDARVIDGAVNGTGHLVRESAGALRLLQTGSVRVYAASLFTGALLVLGYYLAR